uniref:Uncharacterized protein n=1 Tax=Plectus sambesii TaxID=2011161 RepID=A0A914WJM1_9BILA
MGKELVMKTEIDKHPGDGVPHEIRLVSGPDSTSVTDEHLLDVLRRNVDIVKLLSELESDESITIAPAGKGSSLPVQVSTVKGDGKTLSGNVHGVPFRQTTIIRPVQASPDFGLTSAASLFERLRARLAIFYVELLDDLSQTNDDMEDVNAPPKNLSVKALHRDVKRCVNDAHPYLEMVAGFHDIFTWKSPLVSLMLFFVYSFSVYKGWLFSVVLFVLLLQLIINYLSTQKNIDLGLNFLPKGYVPKASFDLSGAHLVFDVAKYCQMFLEMTADVMEKVKHLLIWTHPRVSATFFVLILFTFLQSLFIPMRTLFTVIGLLLGGKAFLTTYLFHRFPRLRHKFDIAVLFLDRLPTDSELEEEYEREDAALAHDASNDNLTTKIVQEKIKTNGKGEEVSSTSSQEFEVISKELAAAPKVVDDVQREARSCILIDKEKSFPHSMGRGSLVLTYNSLIFTYHRLHKGKQEILELGFDKINAAKK